VRTFECPECGALVEALASDAWHRCAGRFRALRPVAPAAAAPVLAAPMEGQAPPPGSPAGAQGQLF